MRRQPVGPEPHIQPGKKTIGPKESAACKADRSIRLLLENASTCTNIAKRHDGQRGCGPEPEHRIAGHAEAMNAEREKKHSAGQMIQTQSTRFRVRGQLKTGE